jgi:hypothetical protein
VEGETVPLNDFVRNSLTNVVKGFISSLKGVPHGPVRVELKIRDEAGD